MQLYINEAPWKIVCIEKPEHNYMSKLPTDSLSLIVNSKKYPHPYEGENELLYQWLGTTTWKYSNSFTITNNAYSNDAIALVLEKIDTIAAVLINGKKIGDCKNLFRCYHFDIKPFINIGKNSIEIIIYGAETEAYKMAEKAPFPIVHSIYPVQSMHRNFIRKTQCHSGWDWGPAFMVSGIYEVPKIICGNGVVIEGIIPRLFPIGKIQDGGNWKVEIDIHLHNTLSKNINIDEINLSIEKLDLTCKLKNVNIESGKSFTTMDFEASNVNLWWPNGYGEQILYDINISIPSDNWSSKIGFRKIGYKSVDDEYGKSLVFSINDVDIFCKGCNWIPIDAMPALQNKERYTYLIDSMKNANMNMVRVWGGGQYEHNDFYNICDEKGILIWHDFMFACSLYPADEPFLENVKHEIEYQIKRLAHHSSITLWCGNNENVGALGWYEESIKSPFRYIINYDRLNEGVIGKAVKKLDKDRLWWPSSPSAGEGDYSDTFHDATRGDMHNWMVWHEGKPFEAYLDIKPRFCSEFGFQSFPSMSTVQSYAAKEDINPTANTMLHHQKNPRGNQIIIETIARYFRFPFNGVSDFIYLSQVQQAWAIKYAIDAWRSLRPICMGALYWQLNDNWPVASWSSIEYSGHWKILHYEAMKFFQMLYGCIYIKNNTVLSFMINDNNFDIDLDVKIIRINFNGKVIEEKKYQINIQKLSSVNLLEQNVDETDKYNEFIIIEWKEKNKTEYLRSFSWLSLPRQANINKSNIKYSISKENDEIYIILETDKPAFYVVLEIQTDEDKLLFSQRHETQTRERFSDNNITLLPNEKIKIKYIGDKNVEEIYKYINIKSLYDTY